MEIEVKVKGKEWIYLCLQHEMVLIILINNPEVKLACRYNGFGICILPPKRQGEDWGIIQIMSFILLRMGKT